MTTMIETQKLNGIDTDALRQAIATVTQDPSHGQTRWSVASHWCGGTRSEARVTGVMLGGQTIPREFTIGVDEPLELFGTNRFANPQEHLLAALNACMIVGYAALCALEGITLEELRITTAGDIDLRGFMGIDPTVKPGYGELAYTVHIKGDGTAEQFAEIHRRVMATSPNYFNLATSIPLRSRLVVG